MSEISREQEYVAAMYERVDELREEASARLALALREEGGTAQSRLERDAAISRYAGQLARLEAAEDGLCFGRLDLQDGECRHIGRIGLRDAADEGEPLLVDWRAPAARAFYVATAGAPHGVRRRRHIAMRGRRVTGVDDEVMGHDGLAGASGLAGEAALLAALEATRTGRMRNIVGTLQAEQDAIIRSAHSGVLVVQGGPGTGKTAVALHRAAYLLYTHRHLAERGVLVVGPSTVFLGYISQVLPGLGETNVLLRTVGELFPGVTADRAEGRLAEEVKGRAMMAGVLAAAIRDRQAAGPAEIEFAGETLRLEPAGRGGRPPGRRGPPGSRTTGPGQSSRGRSSPRSPSGTPNAPASLPSSSRPTSPTSLLRLARRSRPTSRPSRRSPAAVPMTQLHLADIRRELWADPDVRAQLDDLWPALTPQRFLEDLFASPARLAAAAPGLTAAERAALLREPGAWSSRRRPAAG